MPSPRRLFSRRGLALLAVSLFFSTALIVPAAWVTVPYIKRQMLISDLTAADLDQRLRALNFVANHAAEYPGIRRGAIRQLKVPRAANFAQIVDALQRAGLWRPEHIPDDAWLRWIELLLSDTKDAGARILGVQKLADRRDLAAEGHRRVPLMLQSRLHESNRDVRYNTLVAAAELCGYLQDEAPQQVGPFEQLVIEATEDPEPEIARQAWLFLGLLDPASGLTANWRDAEPRVGEAILWAATVSNPDQPSPAIAALEDPDAAPELRVMAAYCLGLSRAARADAALRALVTQPPLDRSATVGQFYARRRAVLGLDRSEANRELAVSLPQRITALTLVAMQADHEAAVLSLTSAWVHRFADAVLQREAPTPTATDAEPAQSEPDAPLIRVAAIAEEPESLASRQRTLFWLAALEGATPGKFRFTLTEHQPPLIALAAARVAREPETAWLRPILASEHSGLRDLACLIAADRLSERQLDRLIESLLSDYDDRAKLSGAVLAALTGRQTELLKKRAGWEDIWAVKQIMELALWVLGESERDASWAGLLLTRRDLPTSSILLCLLHADHPDGWGFLLSPRGDERIFDPQMFQAPPPDPSITYDDPATRPSAEPPPPEQLRLLELLERYRWWLVLDHYLPQNAPPLWVWADRDLQQFQLDVLRNWAVIHRHRLTGKSPRSAKG